MQESYTIAGIKMDWPIILGAGPAKNPLHLLNLIGKDIPLGAYVVGSFTPDWRPENEGVNQWPADWTSFLEEGGGLNSKGMPNSGTGESVDILESVPLDRPAIVSHAAFEPAGYPASMEIADRSQSVAGHEANASCGNTGKQPYAYDIDATRETLGLIGRSIAHGKITKPILWKMAPLITLPERDTLAQMWPRFNFDLVPVVDEGYVERYVRVVLEHPFVRAIVWGNTLMGVRAFDESGKTMTEPFEGRAGLSGPILKAISHRLIRRVKAMLKPWESIDLIASGGNLTGDDIIDALEIEAVACQCASGPVWHPNAARFFAGFLDSERFQAWFASDQH